MEFMQSRSPAKPLEWRYGAMIFILIFASFSPYLFLDFGFHNDFTIWEYNNRICCSGFPENPHLINVGRFLQAYLQGFYLSFFTDLGSLAFGRAAGMAVAGLGAVMLASAVIKNGMGRVAGAAFGAAVFLLPSAQVNLGWVTNFVPGLFNAVLVLYAASIFPAWQALSNREKSARTRLGASFLILLATLFNYPPTIGFFLIPVMVRIVYSGVAKRDERTQALYAIIFFVLVCLAYFIIHRFVYMKLLDITFPQHSFYRFDIARDLLGNAWMFLTGIVPVMLNLWNPAPVPAIAWSVFFLITAPAAYAVYRNCQTSASREVLARSAIITIFMIVIFGAINAPGMLAIGRPPAFYRTWHPGTAAVLFLLFHSIESLRWKAARISAILACLATGCFFSFNSSMYLASTLSSQFKHAVAQISAQFSRDRDRYIIVEKRPESRLFGRQRWGELGFIHILPRGHGIYILGRYFDYHVHPVIQNIVARQQVNHLLLESELLEKSSSIFPRSHAEADNTPFGNIFDHRADTFYEMTGSMPSTIDVVGSGSASIACYRIYAGIDTPPSRAPRAWRLSGSNDGRVWEALDSQSNQIAWREGENRVFVSRKTGNYKHYRFEIDRTGRDDPVQIAEMQLFTLASACQEPDLPEEHMIDSGLIKSITSTTDAISVSLAGTATASSLSDPPFRLQRALDNIYYTFWETRGPFPIKVDFRFFAKKKIQCYAFQAGADRAGDRMPRSWKLLGSNDGLTWNVLDSRADEPAWSDAKGLGDANNNARRRYLVPAPDSYWFYKMEFLSVYDSEGIFRLYEMALSEDRDCLHSMP